MTKFSRVLLLAVIFVTACGPAPSQTVAVTSTTSPTPTATAVSATTAPTTAVPTPSPRPGTITEAQAWARIRSSLPAGVPIGAPTWLPASVDRDHVELQGVVGDSSDPRFVLTYRGAKGAIVYALGAAAPIQGSGYGTSVRGVPATLTFAISLWSDPNTPAPRRVRWEEGGRTLSISSDTYSGDDLLHIAYQLEPAAPAKDAFPRLAPGACAKPGGSADETVRMLISLSGHQQVDAVTDCFGDIYLRAGAPNIGTIWSSNQPTATLDSTRQADGAGGRPVVIATWTFASDPGGAWGLRPMRFFTLGLENGAWRIQEIGTAAIGPPP